MWAPRPPPASSSAGAAAAQNPSAAAPSPPRPRRVREEGEVSSGADDDEVRRVWSAAASNGGKHMEISAQAVPAPAPATFPGKGGNTLSVLNVMAHKTAGPSYKKPMRVNQGQFKPGTNRNLTWQKPVTSDNLVITFSDDDSGADSEKSKKDRVRDAKASSQGTQKTGKNMQTRIVREEASWQKTHGAKIGSTNFPAFSLSLRNGGAGRGSGSTFVRKELPLRQVTPVNPKQKDGNGGGVKSADHRLESLRHKMAARENELKSHKRPLVAVATTSTDFCSDQTRLPLEKKGSEDNTSSDCLQLDSQFAYDARSNKRLKLNQQQSYNQVHSDLVTVAPNNCSSGVNNVKSSEMINQLENGLNMNCNVNGTEHTVTTEPSDQHIQQGDATNKLPSSQIHHKGIEGAGNHDTVDLPGRLAAVPFTSGQSIPADTSTLVPVTSSQARQRVPPVGTSTVPNRRLHLEPGEENADPLNCNGQIGVEGRKSRLFYLLEMEELQERELEEAQEHRRKCEVEEREALRAYRRAQRALLEANERCTALRQRRELRSAQVHGLIAENSSLVQLLSIQNAGEGLAMPSLLSSRIHEDFQMIQNQGARYNPYTDESPQHSVDKHEARPHSREHFATSTADPNFVSAANDNSVPSDYMDDYLFPARQARSKCALGVENRMDETIQVFAQENRQTSADNAQDYELLEASLRSRLVERFGKKTCLNLNSTEERNEEPAVGKVAGAEYDKQLAHIRLQLQSQEAEQNLMTVVEGTMELEGGGADRTEKTGDLSNSSNGPSMGNCDPEDNICSLGELCTPLSMNSLSFPSSAPQNAASHLKRAFPGFGKESSHDKNDCLANVAASEDTECVQDMILDCVKENVNSLRATGTDNDMAHSGIDPFWPFCMFELRGKCNDEECQWQHAENHSWRKLKHTKHAKISVSGWIPYSLFQHILPVPAYRVGSNLIKADLNLMQSVLASSLWQYWQRGFCASFPVPLSVQRVLPSGTPFLQAGDGWIADSDSNRHLLNFRMLDSRKTKIIQGSVDVELFLESALAANCGKAQKPDRVKALLLLVRSIEADPSTAILWVFYLHIYYQKDEGLGKDDMFSHAVQHNVYSYELWLMYINSRLRFDDRLDAYNDALSMLSQMTTDTDDELKERSASILDIFLQMIYFLCMSGNVEKAISRIFGILPTATHGNTGDKLLADVISCLTMSDRCIFWISCLYVSMYRKLPEEITSQLEYQKALPCALAWLPIEPSVDNRSQIIDLLTYAADKMAVDISESVKNGDPSYLSVSQFITVNHISCLAALEGFKSSADMLVKYMEEYPMCPQILLFSARLDRKYATCPGLKGFDELLSDWPKEVHGIQYLWNQYIEHALAENIELAEKVLTCWYEKYGEDHCVQSDGTVDDSIEASEYPSPASAEEVGSDPCTSEDEVYRLLNLSLYMIFKNNLKEALVAVDKALKSANEECYEHCLREHAVIHILEKSSAVDAFSFIIGYLADHRNLPTRELLSRRFCKNVKKNSLKQLIEDTIGPPSGDPSMINSVLEVCFGRSLLPGKIGEVKHLVDFVESAMEVLPANYRLALAVGRFVDKHYRGADPTSMGMRFWSSSVLINAIFRAVPVAPESVWLEAATLLEKLHAAETVKRFHQQATSVYPFSLKLWHAYFNCCKASGSNTESIMESARQRGIELNLTP